MRPQHSSHPQSGRMMVVGSASSILFQAVRRKPARVPAEPERPCSDVLSTWSPPECYVLNKTTWLNKPTRQNSARKWPPLDLAGTSQSRYSTCTFKNACRGNCIRTARLLTHRGIG